MQKKMIMIFASDLALGSNREYAQTQDLPYLWGVCYRYTTRSNVHANKLKLKFILDQHTFEFKFEISFC